MIQYNGFLNNKEYVINGRLGGAPRINSSVTNTNNDEKISKIKFKLYLLYSTIFLLLIKFHLCFDFLHLP